MKYNYKRYNKSTIRPVIPIKLSKEGKEIGYEVLVDSGADLCIFNSEIGEAIGIDISKGKPMEVFGIGGKASVYYLHPVKINVGGWDYEIEAGFMQDVAGRMMNYGVVGQKGFFEHFTIKFDLKKEIVELKDNSVLKQ